MKHICIYTTLETFEHKKNFGGYMYWELRNVPKLYQEYDRLFEQGKKDNDVFDEKPRIYFAYDGMIRGYFIVDTWEDKGWFKVEFDSDSWKSIKPIPTKPHQGFKYIIHLVN